MSLLDLLRRKPPIQDLAGLAQFIDEQAAFVTQRGIYEYSRARAGHYAKVLLVEPEFLAAVEQSRWQAYPLGLAMIAEVVEAPIRPRLGERQRAAAERLAAIVLSVFDRYPVPAPLGETAWQNQRAELAQRLGQLGRDAAKHAKDIPEPFAEAYFAAMPIHEKLRGRDFGTTRNYLKVTLCNIHDEFVRRGDLPAIAAALSAGAT